MGVGYDSQCEIFGKVRNSRVSKQLYENQHTFFDIVRYLDELGFILCGFKPQGQKKFAGEIVEANCFFIKKDISQKQMDMAKRPLWMKANSIDMP